MDCTLLKFGIIFISFSNSLKIEIIDHKGIKDELTQVKKYLYFISSQYYETSSRRLLIFLFVVEIFDLKFSK